MEKQLPGPANSLSLPLLCGHLRPCYLTGRAGVGLGLWPPAPLADNCVWRAASAPKSLQSMDHIFKPQNRDRPHRPFMHAHTRIRLCTQQRLFSSAWRTHHFSTHRLQPPLMFGRLNMIFYVGTSTLRDYKSLSQCWPKRYFRWRLLDKIKSKPGEGLEGKRLSLSMAAHHKRTTD